MKKPYHTGPSYDMLDIPFHQVWHNQKATDIQGQTPNIGTTLYITKVIINTPLFDQAGIQICGHDPYYVPFYLWGFTPLSHCCLDLTKTPIVIQPCVLWRVAIENSTDIISNVEVFGHAVILYRKD